MTIIITILMFVLGGGVAWITLNEDICSRIPLLTPKPEEPEEEDDPSENELPATGPERRVGPVWRWAISCLLGVACAISAWLALSGGEDIINLFRLLISLLCVIGSGCVDFREERIPNLFPAVLSLGGILLLVLGFVTGQDGAMAYLVSCGIAAGGCAIAMGIIALIARGGIGAGDIKLLCSLGIMCGADLMGTIFFAVVPCALVAAILLLTKKKKKNGSLPFGPFILIGYLVTVIASLM